MATNPQRAPWWKRLKVKILEVYGYIDMMGHKIINLGDGSSASQDACSVAQMEAAVTAAVAGLHWQDNIIRFEAMVTNEPVAPSDGDSFISTETGAIPSTSQAVVIGDICRWNATGTTWTIQTPEDGWAVIEDGVDPNKVWVWNGTIWGDFGSMLNHAVLLNLNWSVAAHVMDTDLDMNSHKVVECPAVEGPIISDAGIEAGTGKNTFSKMGDNAGVNSHEFRDSDDAVVAKIDSDGNLIVDGSVNFKIYSQAAEPTLIDGEIAVWNDTDDSSRWFISRFSGSQKKVELAAHQRLHVDEHEYSGAQAIVPANIGQYGIPELDAGGKSTSPPQIHGSSHEGGSDAISPAGIGAEPADATIMKESENVSLLTNDSDYQSGAQVDSDILTHKNITDAHHAKYTDAEAEADVKANVEVGDLKLPTKVLDMNYKKIANCNHVGEYNVSDTNGDDTNGDGSQTNPFKTAQAAYNFARTVMFDQVIVLRIDSNTFSTYSLNVPNYSPQVSICAIEGMLMTWSTFSVIEVGAGNTVSINNLSVDKLKEGTGSNSTTIYIEESYIETLLNNAETGAPANFNIRFAETLLNTAAYTNAKAMGLRAHGKIYDRYAHKSCNLDELSMNSKKITDLANGVLVSDTVNLGQLGKSGKKLSTDFTGTPTRKATVTFNTAFPDTNYSVSVIGVDSRNWSILNKAAGSFDINAGSAVALTDDVDWIATPHLDL